MRGTREGSIIGGAGLILLDLYGISAGRLPVRAFHTIDLATYPGLFWAYAISLGAIGVSALIWGLTRPR